MAKILKSMTNPNEHIIKCDECGDEHPDGEPFFCFQCLMKPAHDPRGKTDG